MNRRVRRRVGMAAIVIVVVFSVIVPAGAQSPLQPAVDVVFSHDSDLTVEQERSADLLAGAVLGEFRSVRRYRLERLQTQTDARTYADSTGADQPFTSVAFFSLGPDDADTLTVEVSVWNGTARLSGFSATISPGSEGFGEAQAVAQEARRHVDALFSGFARLRFTNTGVPGPYYVYANGSLLGPNVVEIELRRGSYTVEVRRRDAGFEHTVARSELQLAEGDLVEVQFSLREDPPPVPAVLALIDPADRWRALFDLSANHLIALSGFDQFENVTGVSGMATVLFNDVGLRSLLVGLEGGYLLTNAELQDPLGPSFDASLDSSHFLGTAGFSVGPVAGVDILFRGSAGVALWDTELEVPDPLGVGTITERSSLEVDPAYAGVMEIGFAAWGDSRVSLRTGWFGIDAGEEFFSWLTVGLGVGGRF